VALEAWGADTVSAIDSNPECRKHQAKLEKAGSAFQRVLRDETRRQAEHVHQERLWREACIIAAERGEDPPPEPPPYRSPYPEGILHDLQAKQRAIQGASGDVLASITDDVMAQLHEAERPILDRVRQLVVELEAERVKLQALATDAHRVTQAKANTEGRTVPPLRAPSLHDLLPLNGPSLLDRLFAPRTLDRSVIRREKPSLGVEQNGAEEISGVQSAVQLPADEQDLTKVLSEP
jgi:hypothetical protein